MKITHHLDMDLVRQPLQLQIPVSVVQGDANTRAVTLTLYQDGTPWEVPAGTTAAVAFRKPDGHKGLYDALPDGTPAVTLSGNTLTAILAPQALTCAGEVGVSVVLWDDRQDQLATFPFRVLVEANPAAGAQVSDNYYKLQNLEQVNAAYDALLTHVEFLTQQVEAGIGVTDEQIAAVVESYLNENPPEAVTDGQLAQAVERYMAENPASGTIHVTGAAPGQTPVVKTVDGSGIPTAWEMAAFPTDTHIRSLIDTALGVIENGTY